MLPGRFVPPGGECRAPPATLGVLVGKRIREVERRALRVVLNRCLMQLSTRTLAGS